MIHVVQIQPIYGKGLDYVDVLVLVPAFSPQDRKTKLRKGNLSPQFFGIRILNRNLLLFELIFHHDQKGLIFLTDTHLF